MLASDISPAELGKCPVSFRKRDSHNWRCCPCVNGDSTTSLDAQSHQRVYSFSTDGDEFGINHIVLAAILLAMISAVPGRRLRIKGSNRLAAGKSLYPASPDPPGKLTPRD
jgi:hypothetical protein